MTKVKKFCELDSNLEEVIQKFITDNKAEVIAISCWVPDGLACVRALLIYK